MKLKRINTLLLILIVLVNGYVIVGPFLPRLVYWWQDRGAYAHSTRAHLQQQIQPVAQKHTPFPSDNRLIVPAMHLDMPIIEGPNEYSLMKGPWRLPQTSTPDKGGNTVIAGHRFTYNNPQGTFYFLDKVHVGDTFAIYWQSKEYLYQVASSQVVPPTQISIEAPTSAPEVTLFTCTPIWWPKNRLVIVGSLEKIYE